MKWGYVEKWQAHLLSNNIYKSLNENVKKAWSEACMYTQMYSFITKMPQMNSFFYDFNEFIIFCVYPVEKNHFSMPNFLKDSMKNN